MLTLDPGAVTLAQLRTVLSDATPVTLNANARQRVETSAQRLRQAASADTPIYGVNTGFGKLASVRIATGDLATLQRNLILSHCAGVGAPTPPPIVRLMMALKLISLGRGASGVRLDITDLIEAMLARGVIPVVPQQGSVGASGDLAPLAHMSAVMIGEGEAIYDGRLMTGAAALAAAGLAPITLAAKEGLALINGTQFSTAYALAGLCHAYQAAAVSTLACALSIDAAKASTDPLTAEIHELRGHPGQIRIAAAMRDLLAGSIIRDSHRDDDPRVQDPYCLRCHPQVAGAALDLIDQAAATLVREANAATDNPLVLHDRIVSGGNFHAEPVAFAADMLAMAIAELGAISQRRIALLVDPTLSYDLPPFLAAKPGLNSGLMIAEVTSAALMSENKHLAHACSTDSTPTSANQEDHVSMAAHAARRLAPMADNVFQIIGIEVFCAATGIGFRAPEQTSSPLQRVLARFHADVPPLLADRLMQPCLAKAAALARGPALLQAASFELSGFGG